MVFMFVIRTWHSARAVLPPPLHTVQLLGKTLSQLCRIALSTLAPLLDFDESSLDPDGGVDSDAKANANVAAASLFVWQATSEQYNDLVRQVEVGTVSGRRLASWLKHVAAGQLPLLEPGCLPTSLPRFRNQLAAVY